MNNKPKLSGNQRKLKLVVVTKKRSVEEIKTLHKKIAFTRIAENRLDEAKKKFPKLDPGLEKHFIGKLQSRKIKDIVKLFDVIQSLENFEQAQKINACGEAIKVFLQVNTSGQKQRSGCTIKEAPGLIKLIQALPNLNLIGVMGMASQSPELARKEFSILKSLQGDLAECSMGMSNDWGIALEEGSTMLRLGSTLFKEDLPPLPDFE